eukprot:14222-Hanusia_phi.AAC.1
MYVGDSKESFCQVNEGEVDKTMSEETAASSASSVSQSEPLERWDRVMEFAHFYSNSHGNFLQQCLEERMVFKFRPSDIFFSYEPLSALLAWPPTPMLLMAISVVRIVESGVEMRSVQVAGYYSLVIGEKGVREFSTDEFVKDRTLGCSWEMSVEMASRFISGIAGIIIGLLALRRRIDSAKLV